MFFSLTPHFFSPYSTFIRIRWLKYWVLVSGQGRRDVSEWGKVSGERERGQPSLVPVSSFQNLTRVPEPLISFLLDLWGGGEITSDNQDPSQKRLISHPWSLNRRILSVISPEWLLCPWWIFKPFLLESTGQFPNPFTISTCHGSWEISEMKVVSLFTSK